MVARRSAQSTFVIVSLHVATGGAIGALAGNRRRAAVLGAAALLAIAARRGALHPATVGAFASSVPDIEHIVRLPRPGGRKLFPSHRIRGFHRSGGISAQAQLLAAGIL